jgi:hypothetical protein
MELGIEQRMMRISTLTSLIALCLAIPLDVLHAATVGPDLTLPDADRLAIETNLGTGRLGPPVPATPIDNPSDWFPGKPGTQHFQVIQGSDSGTPQAVEWIPAPTNPSMGRYQFGHDEVLLLRTERDGSMTIEGVEDIQAQSITRYDPPEPFLLRGLSPGDSSQARMSVKVFSSQDPKEITHQGELQVAYEYLGAFRLSLPAGTFDALVTKSTFIGKVGPAKIQDIQYRFFAPHVGLVATIENRQVSALLVYQSNTSITKVLSQTSH